jgi:hypothetical protein
MHAGFVGKPFKNVHFEVGEGDSGTSLGWQILRCFPSSKLLVRGSRTALPT